jgi:hypothetical protein
VKRALYAAVLVAALGGCEADAAVETPDGAVRAFFELVRGYHGDEREAAAIHELLSTRARKNLEARAERYGAASGKTIAPWAMLVPSRMVPRFPPQGYSAQIVGKYALVEVVGVGPTEVARVPCVLEEGAWRLDLVLPELPPVQRRPGIEP